MGNSVWPRETIESLMASGAILAHKDGNYGSLYPGVEEFGSVGVPFLTAKSISDGTLDIEGAPRLADNRADALRFGFVQPNDVLLSHNATIGRVAIVPDFGGRLLVGTSLTYFRLNPAKLSARYFASYLAGADFQNQLVAVMSHSTRNQVPITAQRKLSIVIPPLETQHAIAAVLGALDDKIEQNRQTARALDRLARAIFRAWFVDFEPVKAKAAGAISFPSMPQPVFDVLPTGLVDSDIGPVPDGWEAKRLDECVHLTMGQSPPSEYYNESVGLPFHQGVTDYGFRFPKHRVYCTVESRIAEPRDVLLSVRAPVGRINVADRRLVLGRGVAGLRHRAGRQSLLLHQLAHVFAEEDAVGDGTIYKAVTKQFLSAMPMLSAHEDTQAAFEIIARPLDDLIASSEAGSRKLAEMRDYLLPKLLGGSVRAEVARG